MASRNAHISNSLHLPGEPAATRIVVAMSGGVDSSVVAGLLSEQGYDVIGITLQLYDHGDAVGRKGACCAGQDIHDARRVAAQFGIPHYVLNYERRFASTVMSGFADSYLAGETPVPCIACNSQIKFTDLLDTARDLGAGALATGHYIASRPGPGGWELLRAEDAGRDQSYFLFNTTREQLGYLRFPLGDMRKSETRDHARRFGLAIADKSDSQDICFVPTGRYTSVIEKLRPGAADAGDIVHMDGRVLGRHDGIINYTIGQRRGLRIAGPEPLYVVHLDANAARVVVGPREALRAHRLCLRDVNWIGDRADMGAGALDVAVRIRSAQAPRPATIHGLGTGDVTVTLHDGEDGVSPGQACVFYDSDAPRARVLGGGWIAHAHSVPNAASRRSASPSLAANEA